MAKGTLVTEAMVIGIFEQIKMNPEITNTELGKIWMRAEDTIAKIRRTGSLEGWKAEKKRKAELERRRAEERRKKAEEKQEEPAEEQVPGQIRMEIPEKIQGVPMNVTYADEIGREYPENVKMMRFQAAQVDKLILKLDRLNDTMSMILRAVRKE